MSQYHLHPAAEAEILETKSMLTRSFKYGLITRERASELLTETIARLMMQAKVESSDDRIIEVTCRNCSRAHRMRSDVIEYRCPCDPNVVRFAMAEQTRSTNEEA